MKNPRLKRFSVLLLLILCLSIRTTAQITAVTLPAGLQPASASEMAIYNHELYIVLQNDAHNTFYLYRYNAVSFTNVPLPANYKLYADTEFEVLNGKLYFMPYHAATDTTAEILAYNGTSFNIIHIPESVMPRDSLHLWEHRPFSYNGKLYIEVAHDQYNPVEPEYRYNPYWIMYDGSVFTRRHLAASLMTFAPYYTPQPASEKVQYNGKLYARYWDYITNMHQLLESNGASESADRSHYGIIASPGNSEMIAYNGSLYIPIAADGFPNSPARLLNRFDGVSQTAVPLPAGLTYANTSFEIYGNKLWGAMNDGSAFPQLYSYDGTTFTHLPLPAGVNIKADGDFREFGCKMYFTATTGATIGGELVYTLYKYSDFRFCARIVAPAPLERFDQIRFDLYSRGDDWCWTNVNIKWPVVVPCKFPDCIDPLFRVKLSTGPDDIVWSQDFEKPFDLTLPKNNEKPYTTTIALGDKTENLADVIIMDKELVPAGITGISLDINTKKQTFNITAEALKGKKVPFTAVLLDADGKVLWKQDFTAPVSTAITATTDRPGTTLRFATRSIALPKGKVAVSVYPNPSSSQVQINIDTDETKTPARIHITNAQGNVVYDKTVTAPTTERPAALAPGIYIVRVTIGKEEHTSRLVVKPGL